jgi:hypothetical protein
MDSVSIAPFTVIRHSPENGMLMKQAANLSPSQYHHHHIIIIIIITSSLHHHHHHRACKVLGLMICSGPTNSLEILRGLVLVFVSRTVGKGKGKVHAITGQEAQRWSKGIVVIFVYPRRQMGVW